MRGIELIAPANTLQPATMMRTDRGLDALTYPSIDARNQAIWHRQSLPAGRRAEARELASRLATPLKAHVDLLIDAVFRYRASR
jgi:hypothetical protein